MSPKISRLKKTLLVAAAAATLGACGGGGGGGGGGGFSITSSGHEDGAANGGGGGSGFRTGRGFEQEIIRTLQTVYRITANPNHTVNYTSVNYGSGGGGGGGGSGTVTPGGGSFGFTVSGNKSGIGMTGSGSGSYQVSFDTGTGEILINSVGTGTTLDEIMGSAVTLQFGMKFQLDNGTGNLTIEVYDVDGTTLRRRVVFNIYRVFQGYGIPLENELSSIYNFTTWSPGSGDFFSYTTSGSSYSFSYGSSLTELMSFSITPGTVPLYGSFGRPSLPAIPGSPASSSLPTTGGIYVEMTLVGDTTAGTPVYFRYDATTSTWYFYTGSSETTYGTLTAMTAVGGVSSGRFRLYYNESTTVIRIIVYSDSFQTTIVRDFSFSMYDALTTVISSGALSGFLRRYAIRNSSGTEYSNGAFGGYSASAGSVTMLSGGSFGYDFQFIYTADTTAVTPTDHEIRMSVDIIDSGITPPVPGTGNVIVTAYPYKDMNNGATIFMIFNMVDGNLYIEEGVNPTEVITFQQLAVPGGHTFDSTITSMNLTTSDVTIDFYSGDTTTLPDLDLIPSILTRRMTFNLNDLINSPATILTNPSEFSAHISFPVYKDRSGATPYNPTWQGFEGSGNLTLFSGSYNYEYGGYYTDTVLEYNINSQYINIKVQRGQVYQQAGTGPGIPPPAPVPATADSTAITPVAPVITPPSLLYDPPNDTYPAFLAAMLNGVDPASNQGQKIATIAKATYPMFRDAMDAFVNGRPYGGNRPHPLVNMRVAVN